MRLGHLNRTTITLRLSSTCGAGLTKFTVSPSPRGGQGRASGPGGPGEPERSLSSGCLDLGPARWSRPCEAVSSAALPLNAATSGFRASTVEPTLRRKHCAGHRLQRQLERVSGGHRRAGPKVLGAENPRHFTNRIHSCALTPRGPPARDVDSEVGKSAAATADEQSSSRARTDYVSGSAPGRGDGVAQRTQGIAQAVSSAQTRWIGLRRHHTA